MAIISTTSLEQTYYLFTVPPIKKTPQSYYIKFIDLVINLSKSENKILRSIIPGKDKFKNCIIKFIIKDLPMETKLELYIDLEKQIMNELILPNNTKED